MLGCSSRSAPGASAEHGSALPPAFGQPSVARLYLPPMVSRAWLGSTFLPMVSRAWLGSTPRLWPAERGSALPSCLWSAEHGSALPPCTLAVVLEVGCTSVNRVNPTREVTTVGRYAAAPVPEQGRAEPCSAALPAALRVRQPSMARLYLPPLVSRAWLGSTSACRQPSMARLCPLPLCRAVIHPRIPTFVGAGRCSSHAACRPIGAVAV
ncbi:hypothetical protein M2421_000708 [Stenotrophomonas sp. BIGb0135]|nr:hypothetical protein [Stenotrophomonas sp. BIGb0135]